ncbi:MAG: TonB-dependent receptor, partial [Pseudomonadota bacterium]
HSRNNYAAYVDVEHDVSDAWLMQYALRFEDFSDFGSTVNGKVATRYSLNDTTNLRAAISTGFHAPTPGQSNVETVITTFDGVTGNLTLEGLVPSSSAEAEPEGGKPLEEEESLSFSLGVSTALGPVDLTVDGYFIQVDGRIYRTGDIPIAGSPGSTISFYTNALDVEHKGIDVVLTSELEWSSARTDVIFAFNYNQVEVTDQSAVQTSAGPVLPVSDSTIEDIENNYPETRFTLTANTYFSDALNFMARANFYGSHFDERGTINGDPGSQSAEIDSIVFVDVELGYQINDNARVVLGATNVFDEFPDEIPNDGVFANRQSVGLQYPRRTPVNYEGGSYYLKASYSF